MPFKPRKMDEVDREGRSLPTPGRKDLTLTKVETGTSQKGDPQMIFDSTVDRGPDSGFRIRQWFTFSEKDDITWARLANICDAAGFTWDEKSTLDLFAAQFPTDGSFRYSADIEISYRVQAYLDDTDVNNYTKMHPRKSSETPYERWVNVTEEAWGKWEGEKRAYPGVRDGFDFSTIYQKPEGEAELKRDKPEDEVEEEDGELIIADDQLPF